MGRRSLLCRGSDPEWLGVKGASAWADVVCKQHVTPANFVPRGLDRDQYRLTACGRYFVPGRNTVWP
jgi:hypothetical protein